jgi:uncharacterized protein (DUF2062 family)
MSATPTVDSPGERKAGWMRRTVERLAALDDSPQRVAAAFAVGVFLSFSPFLGFQIALGLAAALAFRLHKVAVFAGLWANLPWIMIPWYVSTTTAAGALMGLPLDGDLGSRIGDVLALPVYRAEFWQRGFELLGPYLWCFLTGPTLGAGAVGIAAYVASLRLLARRTASPSSG